MLRHHVETSGIDCFAPEFYEGPFTHIVMYIKWWPKQVLGGLITIVLIFAGPQLLYSNYRKILKFLDMEGGGAGKNEERGGKE